MTEVNSNILEKKNKQIMETISGTQDIISKAKQKLDQMAELNKSMEQSSKVVMRENMHRSLTKQLIDTGLNIYLFTENLLTVPLRYSWFIQRISRQIPAIHRPEIVERDPHREARDHRGRNRGY